MLSTGSASVPAVTPGAAARVLFVGPSPDPGWVSALEKRKIGVAAASPELASRSLDEWRPTCVVVDADVDQVGGWSTIEAQSAAAGARVVLLASPGTLFSLVAGWASRRVQHVLVKPVEVSELLATVQAADAEGVAPRLPSLERIQREYIRAVLVSCEGNVSEAARQLGLYRQSLQRMLRRHSPSR